LRSQREKIEEINEKRKERGEIDRSKGILPTGSVLLQNKQIPIDDYFVRLKTTSVHH